MISCRSTSLENTRAIAAAIAKLVRPRDIIVLAGDMGAGKTAFVAGFADAMGVTDDDQVSSPTFTLVHTYSTGRLPIHHADVYRLTTLGEVADLGLREMADMGAVVLVEWGDVAREVLGDALVVSLAHDDDDPDARDVTVSVDGHGWDTRWEHLRTALSRWGGA
jgi:tRNA threonylcarbamoyladenosine biosynthesis protein TsaE